MLSRWSIKTLLIIRHVQDHLPAKNIPALTLQNSCLWMPFPALPHMQAQSTWAKPKTLPREGLTANQHSVQLRPSPLTGTIPSLCIQKGRKKFSSGNHTCLSGSFTFEVKTCSFVQTMSIHFPVTLFADRLEYFSFQLHHWRTIWNKLKIMSNVSSQRQKIAYLQIALLVKNTDSKHNLKFIFCRQN